MKIFIATILIVIACYVALTNLAGAYLTIQRKRKGISGGYASLTMVSFFLCFFAFMAARDIIGMWAFTPTLIDPGTWCVATRPIFLAWQWFKKS